LPGAFGLEPGQFAGGEQPPDRLGSGVKDGERHLFRQGLGQGGGKPARAEADQSHVPTAGKMAQHPFDLPGNPGRLRGEGGPNGLRPAQPPGHDFGSILEKGMGFAHARLRCCLSLSPPDSGNKAGKKHAPQGRGGTPDRPGQPVPRRSRPSRSGIRT